jgi:hypothetical protein
MKYGVRIPSFALGPKIASLQDTGKYLRHAEDLGFEYAVSIDYLLLTPPAYACTWLEPIAMLSALADVTRTIKLGTMILVLPLRNPVYFAKEWATLDLLSGGRSVPGIGGRLARTGVRAHGRPAQGAWRSHDRDDRGSDGAVGRRKCHLSPQILSVRKSDHRSEAVPDPAPANLDGRRNTAIGKDICPDGPTVDPVLKRIAKYADVWIPNSSSTPEMVRRDWKNCRHSQSRSVAIHLKYGGSIPTLPGFLRRARSWKPRYRISPFILEWTWTIGRLITSLAPRNEIAEQISARITSLDGGVDAIVLNPLNWSIDQLEMITHDVLPRVRGVISGLFIPVTIEGIDGAQPRAL